MKKVLVIEDNRNILENTAEILELANYIVVMAQNGKAGIGKALSTKPDLILCDIMMPELDGYGVLHLVQKNPELEQTPFIFLSAKTERDDIRKGMALGADDYITKPFDPTDLLNAVESRLKKAELSKRKMAEVRNAENEIMDGKEALANFVEGRHTDHYKKRQRIFSEGNHPILLYFLKQGKVKVYKTNDEGKELVMKIVSPGEFFGYISILENSIYKENAEALEESEIAGIPKSEFVELVHSNQKVAMNFIKLLASDVSSKECRLIQIAYNSLRRKVADALLVLNEKYNARPGDHNIHLSRDNVAAIAGTATESLIRTLTGFREEKLIDIKGGSIKILKPDKLKDLVN